MSAPNLIERNPQYSPSHDDANRLEPKKPTTSEHSEHDHPFEWSEIVRIAFVALAAAAVWFRLWEPFPHVSVIGIAAALIGGYPIFKEAFENIVERKMTMELSMTIALLAAWRLESSSPPWSSPPLSLPLRYWRVSRLGEAGKPSRVFSIIFPEPPRSGAMVRYWR